LKWNLTGLHRCKLAAQVGDECHENLKTKKKSEFFENWERKTFCHVSGTKSCKAWKWSVLYSGYTVWSIYSGYVCFVLCIYRIYTLYMQELYSVYTKNVIYIYIWYTRHIPCIWTLYTNILVCISKYFSQYIQCIHISYMQHLHSIW
jgi:hypothetical protein